MFFSRTLHYVIKSSFQKWSLHMHFFRDLYAELTLLVFSPWRQRHFGDVKMKHGKRAHNAVSAEETRVILTYSYNVHTQKKSPYKIDGTFSHKTFTAEHVRLTCFKHTRSLRGRVALSTSKLRSTYNEKQAHYDTIDLMPITSASAWKTSKDLFLFIYSFIYWSVVFVFFADK